MAARRLIAILIALLVVSSFAAALAPQRQSDESTGTTTEGTTATDGGGAEAEEGRLIERQIPPGPGKPAVIELRPGDELRLAVGAASPTEVLIPSLGESRFASPGVPALFDLLLRDAGQHRVTLGDGTTVGLLEVSALTEGSSAG